MSDHEFASNPKPVENTILSHALLYFRTAPRYFLTREGRGLHFFRAIVSERSETQNQALLLPVKSISVNLMKFKKPSNINAFCPSITTARLLMRRAKLYQLMLMMCIECKELIQTHGCNKGVALLGRGLQHYYML